MAEEFLFDGEDEFMEKVHELVGEGYTHEDLTCFAPYPVHGLEDAMNHPPSPLKFFTLAGAITGGCTGLGLCIYTMLAWPLNTGGKPIFSIPAYIIIGFELTILLGAIFSVLGLFILCRLPAITRILPEKEYGNQFAIVVDKKEGK